MRSLSLAVFAALLSFSAFGAEEAVTPETPEVAVPPAASARFMVILPERIDKDWYWYYYTDEVQHVVQTAVEKALVSAGLDLVDISTAETFKDSGSIETVCTKEGALERAKTLSADYVIVGRAIADKSSESTTYGLNVVRVDANANARIVRVSDGKVMAVDDAEATGGGEAMGAAARDALRTAGEALAGKMAAAAKNIQTTP